MVGQNGDHIRVECGDLKPRPSEVRALTNVAAVSMWHSHMVTHAGNDHNQEVDTCELFSEDYNRCRPLRAPKVSAFRLRQGSQTALYLYRGRCPPFRAVKL